MRGRHRFDSRFPKRATIALIAIGLTASPPDVAGQQARTTTANPIEASGTESSLMPGDAIRLAGTREPELPGEYPVDETGTVVLPLLGSRNVTGLPAAELKRQLVADYRQELRNQDVQISLLRRVRVLGAVKNPGIYQVDPTMSVADAIALAGGATHEGKLKGIQVLRRGKVIRSDVDVHTPIAREMQSGDQVIVPERSWFSRNGQYVIGGLITAAGFVIAQVITR
jgi:protein involved in polysaccharide export with SLBB domain